MITTTHNSITNLQQRIADLEAQLAQAQHNEQMLQAVLDNLDIVIFASDAHGTVIAANRLFCDWTGHDRRDLIGNPQIGLPPELLVTWDEQTAPPLTAGQTLESEVTVPGADGIHIYRIRRFALHRAGGEIYGIASTSTEITAQRQLEQRQRENQRLLQGLIENWPAVIYVKNQESRLLIANQAYAEALGRPINEIIGKTEGDLFPPEVVAGWREQDHNLFATGKPVHIENIFQLPDGKHYFLTTQFPIYDDDGAPFAICGVSTDITALKKSEEERETLQNSIIEAQRATLRELSTPLIPLAEKVVAMPLIGSMDSSRAQQVMETLLEGIATYHAVIVILDITGLPVVDTQVADALVRAARAARLLGSEVILTGIRPEVAQTLVGMGADLSGITTLSTLQNGITYALKRSMRS